MYICLSADKEYSKLHYTCGKEWISSNVNIVVAFVASSWPQLARHNISTIYPGYTKNANKNNSRHVFINQVSIWISIPGGTALDKTIMINWCSILHYLVYITTTCDTSWNFTQQLIIYQNQYSDKSQQQYIVSHSQQLPPTQHTTQNTQHNTTRICQICMIFWYTRVAFYVCDTYDTPLG